MKAMLASPSLEDSALMEKHGVVPPITAYIERSWEEGRCSRNLRYKPTAPTPPGLPSTPYQVS